MDRIYNVILQRSQQQASKVAPLKPPNRVGSLPSTGLRHDRRRRASYHVGMEEDDKTRKEVDLNHRKEAKNKNHSTLERRVPPLFSKETSSITPTLEVSTRVHLRKPNYTGEKSEDDDPWGTKLVEIHRQEKSKHLQSNGNINVEIATGRLSFRDMDVLTSRHSSIPSSRNTRRSSCSSVSSNAVGISPPAPNPPSPPNPSKLGVRARPSSSSSTFTTPEHPTERRRRSSILSEMVFFAQLQQSSPASSTTPPRSFSHVEIPQEKDSSREGMPLLCKPSRQLAPVSGTPIATKEVPHLRLCQQQPEQSPSRCTQKRRASTGDALLFGPTSLSFPRGKEGVLNNNDISTIDSGGNQREPSNYRRHSVCGTNPLLTARRSSLVITSREHQNMLRTRFFGHMDYCKKSYADDHEEHGSKYLERCSVP